MKIGKLNVSIELMVEIKKEDFINNHISIFGDKTDWYWNEIQSEIKKQGIKPSKKEIVKEVAAEVVIEEITEPTVNVVEPKKRKRSKKDV